MKNFIIATRFKNKPMKITSYNKKGRLLKTTFIESVDMKSKSKGKKAVKKPAKSK